MEVSGRRTTLVWRRRRFWCGNCGERHLEDHAQFGAGLTRRFARRLVSDARVMSIRAVARHHGVGWHRIMGLVRAEAARVAERRRARLCRVLLVDETSIRRRHRYVTVVACGDSGEVLAMIPGRTKGSLARFFRDQGPDWCRQVEIVVSDGSRSYRAAISQYLPDARHVLDRFHVVRWFTEGLTLVRREIQRRPPPPISGPQHRNRTCSEPGSLCCAGPTTSQTPTGRIWIGCSTLIRGCERLGMLSKSSTRSTRPKTSTGPTQRWDGSLTSTTAARHREYREIVDTIVAWGEKILAYHSSRRVSNGPLEGINNLHPSPTTSRSRVHQLRQLRSPRNPRNMTPTPSTRTAKTHVSRSLCKGAR